MAEIKVLTEAINNFRDARDWRQFHNPKDLSLSISLEAAELLEHFQWKNGQAVTEYLEKGGLGEVKKEMADVMLYLLMLADDLHIDLGQAVLEKLELQEKKYPVEKSKGTATKYDKL